MSKRVSNKQTLLRSLTAFSAALGLIGSPAVDADQIFSGGVNFTGSQVQVGSSFTGPGTLTLNAENSVNGITSITGKNLLYVEGFGGTSTLNVIGDGTAGSASIETDLAWFGVGAGHAVVNIRDGGEFVSPHIIVQQPGNNNEAGTAQVHVTGINSRFQTQLLSLSPYRFNEPPAGGFGAILVDGGALLDIVSTPDDGRGYATGGLAEIGSSSFGGADGLLTVSGSGSRVHFTRYLTVSSGSTGGLVVENGGHLTQIENPGEIDAFLNVLGQTETATLTVGSGVDVATVRVSGTNSAIEVTRNIRIGQAEVFLGYEGGVISPTTAIHGSTSGVILVEDGGLLSTPGRIKVSEATSPAGFTGSGTLTVRSGGRVEASTVEIYDGGVINGDGGTIVGDVVNHAGTVSPGNSPGTITFDGDYTQEADGTLVMQFAGTGAGQFDVLDITGDADFHGTLDLEFIDGFAPQLGDVFDFLLVDGFFNPSFDKIVVSGLASGWQYNTTFVNGTYRLTSLNHAVSTTTTAVPTPAAVWMGLSLLGGLTLRRRRGRRRHRG